MQVGPPRWPLVVHFVAALALAPVVHPMAVMALAFVVHLVTTLGIILTPARRRDLVAVCRAIEAEVVRNERIDDNLGMRLGRRDIFPVAEHVVDVAAVRKKVVICITIGIVVAFAAGSSYPRSA